MSFKPAGPLALALLLLSNRANADQADRLAAPNPPESPFLFMLDPSLPAPGQTTITVGVGNVTRSAEVRPIGAGPIVPTIGTEIGLLPRLSLLAETAFEPSPADPGSPVSVAVGLHVLVTDPTSRAFRIALQLGYGRDLLGASTTRLAATFAWRREILEIAAALVATHTFRDAADALDLGATLAANLRLPAGFRVGVELVTADLEELTDPGDEGGAAAFAGPTVGWQRGQRFELVAGPAFGVGPGTQGTIALARVAATVRF